MFLPRSYLEFCTAARLSRLSRISLLSRLLRSAMAFSFLSYFVSHCAFAPVVTASHVCEELIYETNNNEEYIRPLSLTLSCIFMLFFPDCMHIHPRRCLDSTQRTASTSRTKKCKNTTQERNTFLFDSLQERESCKTQKCDAKKQENEIVHTYFSQNLLFH